MRAGRLRHLVSIRTPVSVPNAVGERIRNYDTVLASVHAEVRDLVGRELLLAQQTSADLTTSVRLRKGSGVTVQCHIIFGTRTLEVVSISNVDNRNVEQVLMCREVVT